MSADTPLSIGCVDAGVFSTPASQPDTTMRASAPSSALAPVYTAPYFILGAGTHGVGSHCTLARAGDGFHVSHTSAASTVVPLPNHIYVFAAVPQAFYDAAGVNTGSGSLRFRLWACRNVTRYVPLPGAPASGKPVLRHPVSHDGPCISKEFDDEMPVDSLLTHAASSAAISVDLEIFPELFHAVSSLGAECKQQLSCAWLTRRVAAAGVHVRQMGLVEACLHWQDWANHHIVNRVRWAYSISIRSENPGDGASLWPVRHQRRASLLSEPSAGTFGVIEGSSHGWGGGRRASVLASQMRPKFRTLERVDDDVKRVAAVGTVWTALAEDVGQTDMLAESVNADTLDTIDLGADHVPLMLPVLHRKRALPPKPTGALDETPAIPAASPIMQGSFATEFRVIDLGDDVSAALAASGAMLGTERVVSGSAAAEVLCAAVLDVCHPNLAFACGLRVIRLLLNDYRYENSTRAIVLWLLCDACLRFPTVAQ